MVDEDLKKLLRRRKLTDEENKKFRVHLVYPAPLEEENKNEAIVQYIRKLQKIYPNVIIAGCAHLLLEYMELPYIKTPEGRKHFGVDGIQRYVEQIC